MKIQKREENESLSSYSARLSDAYKSKNNKNSKKDIGQFFTPLNVAKYMASLITIKKERVSILDPGTGLAVLSVSAIEKLLAKNKKLKEIKLTMYETDKSIIPSLKQILSEVKKDLDKKKIKFTHKIIEKDFVSSNENILTVNLSTFSESKPEPYDIIISNPPYFKMNKEDLQIAKFENIVSGQPNIYFLFMAISAKLLGDSGEMIYITPRSFCSGMYYNKFRSWLIKNVNFSNIHLFNSRKDLFNSESVLQENIITKFTKNPNKKITITKTSNGDFSKANKLVVKNGDVIYRSNGHVFFRIPSDENELRIVRELDKLPYNFYKLGIKISTGKVVAFRNKEFLKDSIQKSCVPLLWMHNIIDMGIKWPLVKKDKESYIVSKPETKSMLLEKGNYVILKRFTTKEQKKRFSTGLIFEDDFKDFGAFALDNMVNYIYQPDKGLTKNQVFGIAQYLNLPIVDLYFRILNGHTQVNANEVYALPFPSLEDLGKIGSSLRDNQHMSTAEETRLIKRLNLNIPILKHAVA